MKSQAENTIQELIGLTITRTTRSANMECLKFGYKLNDINQNIGQFGLHIQTSWRIIDKENILVGSSDLCEPNSENQSEYEYDFDYEDGNLRDEKLKNMIASENLIVSKVITDSIGGLNILFNNKTELQLIPTNSSQSEHNEFWRLLDNRESELKHIVASINGIESE